MTFSSLEETKCTPYSLAGRRTIRRVPSPRTPGQRAGLTRERVLVAARELLVEEGVEGLSMRSVAKRLHVSPNALYSHVESKLALVDEVLDDLLAQVDVPPEDAEPAEGLHRLMTSTYRTLIAHPELVSVYLARQGARGPNAHRLGDVVIGLLARAGVKGAPARAALRVLIVYTIGFAAFAPRDGDGLTSTFDDGLRWLLAGIISA
jgi:TetR/AcrR family tetracycline transcriptional repressor